MLKNDPEVGGQDNLAMYSSNNYFSLRAQLSYRVQVLMIPCHITMVLVSNWKDPLIRAVR